MATSLGEFKPVINQKRNGLCQAICAQDNQQSCATHDQNQVTGPMDEMCIMNDQTVEW